MGLVDECARLEVDEASLQCSRIEAAVSGVVSIIFYHKKRVCAHLFDFVPASSSPLEVQQYSLSMSIFIVGKKC